ncbi:hypothetical protein D3H55_18090 [Bacillus salacetis]|uniref:Uncharacterized protein n=1 Tax=Bacillus salacetis TaxID=2315464 RepID=A0A3A1QRU7_9BACI|nr:hypothetical protein D3H55_18090 [Bacillus salacetis]
MGFMLESWPYSYIKSFQTGKSCWNYRFIHTSNPLIPKIMLELSLYSYIKSSHTKNHARITVLFIHQILLNRKIMPESWSYSYIKSFQTGQSCWNYGLIPTSNPFKPENHAGIMVLFLHQIL